MKIKFNIRGTVIKILIVEDERLISLDMSLELSELGYKIQNIFSSGEEAVEFIFSNENNYPDIILMDINLEGTLNGLETAKIINDKYEIPVIFITSIVDERIIEETKRAGGLGYIKKPFTYFELHTNIQISLYRFKTYEIVKKNEAHFRNIAECLPQAIIDINLDNRINYINKSGMEIFEIDKSDFDKDINFDDFIDEQYKDAVIKHFQEIIRTEKSTNIYTLLKSKYCKHINSHINIFPLFKDARKPLGIRLIITDIMEFLITSILPDDDFYLNYNLTEREIEVVKLLLQGSKYKLISDKLFISMPTVKTHIQSIFKKLKINSQDQLFDIIKKRDAENIDKNPYLSQIVQNLLNHSF